MSAVLVKICGITNPDDALAAAEDGAGALGFNFWPQSPRYITPDAAREIAARLPRGILKAGVFVDEPLGNIREVMKHAGLDVAQIHGDPGAAPDFDFWIALSAGAPDLRASIEHWNTASAFLIDTPAGAQRGGTGRTFDWSLAAGLGVRTILAGGLGPDNVAAAIRAVKPFGVDACSRLESSPGRKDRRKVRDFIQAALSAES
jgi:phosphoribosylanthranilate isomerase